MIHRPPSVRHQARHFLYLGGRETGKPLDYDKLSSTKKSSTVRGHGIEEVLIASGLMIADFIDRNLREKPGAAVNLGIFDSVELHGLKRALGFRYEENVPDVVLLHGDGPVGGIIADGGRNLERPREFGVNDNLVGFVKVMGKVPFALTVGNHIIGDVLGSLISLVKFSLA